MVAGNDTAYLEACRLARRFFPESRGYITDAIGFDWDSFAGAMQLANYSCDHSCDAFRPTDTPDLGLAHYDGLSGDNASVYGRLLEFTAINPTGRVVVVPDALGVTGWNSCDQTPLPFVCAVSHVPERLSEIDLFGMYWDTIFVFESGEAILVDHDERIHWATSRTNVTWRTSTRSPDV